MGLWHPVCHVPNVSCMLHVCSSRHAHITRGTTQWPRPIACLDLQVIFRKRASNYRALLRKMPCKDKASYGSTTTRHPMGRRHPVLIHPQVLICGFKGICLVKGVSVTAHSTFRSELSSPLNSGLKGMCRVECMGVHQPMHNGCISMSKLYSLKTLNRLMHPQVPI